MEEEIFTEAWAWMDDDLSLDTNSTMAISRVPWEDFTSSEAVVRSLFPSTTAKDFVSPVFFSEKPESPECSSSWEIMQDCSPSPLKRRCTLQISEEDMINLTSTPSDDILNDREFIAEAGEGSHVTVPSSSDSLWCIATEESHSSIDNAAEQSSESWMVGWLSDSDTSDVREILPPFSVDSPTSMAVSKTSSARPTVGAASRSRRTPRCAPSNVAHNESHSKPSKDIPGQVQIKRRAHITTGQSGLVKESAGPVLAYPFALVKPSGIQGDVTLQDINQRMKRVPCAQPRRGLKDSYYESLASPLSGKSVVALTKIQTEGNGTITILRTRT